MRAFQPNPKASAVIAFSEAGHALGKRLAKTRHDMTVSRCASGGLSTWVEEHFSSEALIFVSSVGLAVRAISPLVHSKTTDPAVVVIDERGAFVIPILSGHIGQANNLARRLAADLGATAVITTATDVHDLFAVDDWAISQGMKVANPEAIKRVSGRLLAGETIRLATEYPIAGPPPAGVVLSDEALRGPATDSSGTGIPGSALECDVLVTCRSDVGPHPCASPHLDAPLGSGEQSLPSATPKEGPSTLRLIPPVITAGVGCRRGTPASAIEEALREVFDAAGYEPLSLASVCTIDLKADEPGLLDFCEKARLPFIVYSTEELNAVEGDFTTSDFVASVTGVDNVCERAAIAGSQGSLVVRKTPLGGVTVALAMSDPQLSFSHWSVEDTGRETPWAR